jgi:hypothetical protein
MPTADATLLPPVPHLHDPESVRHLDAIGVETVLGTMIEQKRRASQPSFPSFSCPAVDADDAPPSSGRTPARSEAFLKAR